MTRRKGQSDRLPRAVRRSALLRNVPPPGGWTDHAACRGQAPTDGVTPHPFFPTRGEQKGPMEVCQACPVIAYCRTYALRWPLVGFWAGMSELERVHIRRKRREAS